MAEWSMAVVLNTCPDRIYQDGDIFVGRMQLETEAVGRWLTATDQSTPMKGFSGGPIAALGYFIAHDSHHRGSILRTLKLSGYKIDTKTEFAIWEMCHWK